MIVIYHSSIILGPTITNMDNGLEAEVSEGGSNFSVGQ